MKVLWIMLCAFTLLMAEGISQKLIVYTDKNEKNSQESLLRLKVYFIENQNLRALNEENNLKLELETLGAYTMVVVKPVMSLSVKNSLRMELVPVFPDIFALEERATPNTDKRIDTFIPMKNDISKTNRSTEIIGLQWITLLILVIVGLFLSVLRRKRLFVLDKKQKELNTDQNEIENEIKNLGKYDV